MSHPGDHFNEILPHGLKSAAFDPQTDTMTYIAGKTSQIGHTTVHFDPIGESTFKLTHQQTLADNFYELKITSFGLVRQMGSGLVFADSPRKDMVSFVLGPSELQSYRPTLSRGDQLGEFVWTTDARNGREKFALLSKVTAQGKFTFTFVRILCRS